LPNQHASPQEASSLHAPNTIRGSQNVVLFFAQCHEEKDSTIHASARCNSCDNPATKPLGLTRERFSDLLLKDATFGEAHASASSLLFVVCQSGEDDVMPVPRAKAQEALCEKRWRQHTIAAITIQKPVV